MAEASAPETVQATAKETVEGEGQVPETETTETQRAESQVDTTDSEAAVQVTVEDTDNEAGFARERDARKKANREAQNLRERLRKFEEAEEQRKQEAMSELEQASANAEKLQRERDEAAEDAKSVRAELTSLRVRQEATSKALGSGAKQDRLEAVLRLTDLSEATDEDGNPNAKTIEAAIKATLKDYPEFRQGAPSIGGQSNPGAPPQQKAIAEMTSEELAQLSQRAQWGERVTLS